MVHTCLWSKKCQRITQLLTINLKIDINFEACSSRLRFWIPTWIPQMFMVQKMSINRATSHHKSQNRYHSWNLQLKTSLLSTHMLWVTHWASSTWLRGSNVISQKLRGTRMIQRQFLIFQHQSYNFYFRCNSRNCLLGLWFSTKVPN